MPLLSDRSVLEERATPDDLRRPSVKPLPRLRQLREQNLIVIGGGRGTGKSTLARYCTSSTAASMASAQRWRRRTPCTHAGRERSGAHGARAKRHDLPIIDDIHCSCSTSRAVLPPPGWVGTFAVQHALEADKRVVFFLSTVYLPMQRPARARTADPPFTRRLQVLRLPLPCTWRRPSTLNHVFRCAKRCKLRTTISSVVRHQNASPPASTSGHPAHTSPRRQRQPREIASPDDLARRPDRQPEGQHHHAAGKRRAGRNN